ncbi:MAG: hypothetical protein PHT88_03290 [Candidatus Moranbacteria bacterium]|nr:hypothetical protein [Candidatus Moranbacteria bacterium]
MKISVKHIASFTLVLAILVLPQVVFGATIGQQGGWTQGLTNGTTGGVSQQTPTTIVTNIINYALAIIGFLGVLGFIISGIMYLVSAGDEAMAEKAKNNMVYAIIGVIVALLGYVVMAAISTLLSAGGANNGL